MARKRKGKNRRFERRRVLDVKLRSSHRRKARLRALALFVLFLAALVFGGGAIWQGFRLVAARLVYENNAFAIERVEIETDGVITLEQLQRWSGVKAGDNLFALRLHRVRRDLELVPAIRLASVERVLPRTLRIRVREREPVARLLFLRAEDGGRIREYLVDREGYALLPLGAGQVEVLPSYDRLPQLSGVPANRVRPGQRVEAERLEPALALMEAFGDSSMAKLTRLLEVDLGVPGVLRTVTDGPCEVVFGLDGFETQLRRWRAVQDHGHRQGRELTWLDLSVSNNVPARWM